MERWIEHFTSVLNRPEPDQAVTLPPEENVNIKVDNLKKHEIKKALKTWRMVKRQEYTTRGAKIWRIRDKWILI